MAKLPQDYPVTTPYGQVPGYPLNNGFHNGIDYGCPCGTPVNVNGVTIGISNNTGASTGCHLHVGRYVNGQSTNPGVGNGFNFNSAVVFDTGSDATNGNYVRITGDGALWNYLHLQTILVSKGQTLKGSSPQGDTMLSLDDRYKFWRMARLEDPNPDEVKGWDKMDDATFTANLWNNGGSQFKQKHDAIEINDIRAKFLKEIGQAVGLDPDKDGLESIVNKVKDLKG